MLGAVGNLFFIAPNVSQLYAVVCRLCAVGKLRIGAVIGCPSFGMINLKTKIKCQKKNKQQ